MSRFLPKWGSGYEKNCREILSSVGVLAQMIEFCAEKEYNKK